MIRHTQPWRERASTESRPIDRYWKRHSRGGGQDHVRFIFAKVNTSARPRASCGYIPPRAGGAITNTGRRHTFSPVHFHRLFFLVDISQLFFQCTVKDLAIIPEPQMVNPIISTVLALAVLVV